MSLLNGKSRTLNPTVPLDQMKLGGIVDRLLNGHKHQRAQQAFFLFVAPFNPIPGQGGVIVSNQPAEAVVPLMIDWIERYAPGRITVNKLN